jgi:hypothetical protein
MNETYLTGRQTCRSCGTQLQYTWGRATPRGWMHKECALALAAEHAGPGVIYLLDELELEDQEPV